MYDEIEAGRWRYEFVWFRGIYGLGGSRISVLVFEMGEFLLVGLEDGRCASTQRLFMGVFCEISTL